MGQKILTAALALLIGCGTNAEQIRVSSLYDNPNNHWFRGDAAYRLEINLTDPDYQLILPQPVINEEHLITSLNVPREIRELYNQIIPYALEDLDENYSLEVSVRDSKSYFIIGVNFDPNGLYKHRITIYSFDPSNETFQRALIDIPVDGYEDYILTNEGQLIESTDVENTYDYRLRVEEINEILRRYLPE